MSPPLLGLDFGAQIDRVVGDIKNSLNQLVASSRAIEQALAALKEMPGPAATESIDLGYRNRILRQLLLTGSKRSHGKETLSLATANTDKLITMPGTNYLVATCDGSLEGVGVRINHLNNPLVYLTDENSFQEPIEQIYVTNPVQTGKTLTFFIGYDSFAMGQARSGLPDFSLRQRYLLARSYKDTHFIAAIAQYAAADGNLEIQTSRARIVGVTIWAWQRLKYRVTLWAKDARWDADLDQDEFIGEVELDLPTYGWQIPSATGPWRMDLRDLNIDYIDQDAPYSTLAQVGLLHVSLQNLSATTKVLSGAAAALTGAVADDGGVQTDETAAANNAAVNDMTLLPALPVADDAYYFGSSIPFRVLELNIGTAGVGTWTIVWEYYKPDGTWGALAGVIDGSAAFTVGGGSTVVFTLPVDWAQVAIAGITAYWIRARVSLFTAITTQPLGTQALVDQEGEVVLEFAYEPRS